MGSANNVLFLHQIPRLNWWNLRDPFERTRLRLFVSNSTQETRWPSVLPNYGCAGWYVYYMTTLLYDSNTGAAAQSKAMEHSVAILLVRFRWDVTVLRVLKAFASTVDTNLVLELSIKLRCPSDI